MSEIVKIEAWHQQPTETDSAYAAFRGWLECPLPRSYSRAQEFSQQTLPSKASWSTWKREHAWRTRARLYDAKIDQENFQAIAKARTQLQLDVLKSASELNSAGLTLLKKLMDHIEGDETAITRVYLRDIVKALEASAAIAKQLTPEQAEGPRTQIAIQNLNLKEASSEALQDAAKGFLK